MTGDGETDDPAGGDEETTGFGADEVRLESVRDPQRGWRRFAPVDNGLGLTGAGTTVAVVDSGVLSAHPDIAPRLVEQVDFTGEGTEDENGHGTLVALLLLREAPETNLVSLKVLGSRGRGQVRPLLRALSWLRTRPDIGVVNLSAGIYRPTCQGDCSICAAARRLSQAGTIICAAAGNIPGLEACPAKCDAVISVAAIDPATGQLADYSSPGEIAAPTPTDPGFWTPE